MSGYKIERNGFFDIQPQPTPNKNNIKKSSKSNEWSCPFWMFPTNLFDYVVWCLMFDVSNGPPGPFIALTPFDHAPLPRGPNFGRSPRGGAVPLAVPGGWWARSGPEFSCRFVQNPLDFQKGFCDGFRRFVCKTIRILFGRGLVQNSKEKWIWTFGLGKKHRLPILPNKKLIWILIGKKTGFQY